MTAVLEEVVSFATLRAMVAAAWRWPLELLEDLATSARWRREHWCWIRSFLGFGGAS